LGPREKKQEEKKSPNNINVYSKYFKLFASEKAKIKGRMNKRGLGAKSRRKKKSIVKETEEGLACPLPSRKKKRKTSERSPQTGYGIASTKETRKWAVYLPHRARSPAKHHRKLGNKRGGKREGGWIALTGIKEDRRKGQVYLA